MKNECAVVQDLALLYYDKALSPETVDSVEEHLANCAICRDFYEEFKEEQSNEQSFEDRQLEEKEKVISAYDKIKKYRFFQVCLFGGTIIFLLSLMFTWFGYPGVSEIKGTVLLSHPLAIIGLGLLEFSIWYSFVNKTRRKICGYIGAAALVISEFLVLGLVASGSTIGINIGFTHFELLNPMLWKWDWPLMHLGFYITVIITIVETLGFRWFCNNITT